ncbi:carbamoyl phosphate synthase-like protein [Rubripirellula tenax]|uniref:Carbamoyl phosphate synthase-like protein n=1 Tax=Rubripirellula tenax TaxID=2528015 RepID=A0A5C6EFX6_9BACT|nr:ATP-grasp domain-containing protein [Rubripirellula tenax]TWU47500.1 carbamoyl phosphate synthase-like protein [Rubripirellula tenax]
MRIFVGEYVCGGGLANESVDQIPASLRQEGAAMLSAVASDLTDVAETVVPLDARFESLPIRSTHKILIDPSVPFWNQWTEAAKTCDAAIVVAPESDGILAKAVAILRAGGVDVIAGSGDFLRVASDKYLTAKCLIGAGVMHPIYMTVKDRKFYDELRTHEHFVVKPRDGCGTKELKRFDSLDDACNGLGDHELLQAWMPGRAASIAMVASAKHSVFMPAVSQQLCDLTCEYAGGQGPLDDDAQRRAAALAQRAIAALPPTVRGFVGLDLLLGERPSEDYVIEINPRLTTSYVGIRRMIHGNVAARLFDLESGPVSCSASVEAVRWTPDGHVWVDGGAIESAS